MYEKHVSRHFILLLEDSCCFSGVWVNRVFTSYKSHLYCFLAMFIASRYNLIFYFYLTCTIL